ncbi:MAG: adenylate/guanylate cyclase domain-containing protein [Acidimicrobiales bacterium]
MHPIVEVRSPSGTAVLVVVDRRLEIGREAPDVVVADPLTSRRHAALDARSGAVTVEDLGSSNGTLVNGAAITAPTTVGPGDVVLLGDTEVRLSVLAAAPLPPAAAASAAADVRGTTIRGGPMAASPAPPPRPTTAVPPPPPPAPARSVPLPPTMAAPAVAQPEPDVRATSIDLVAAQVVDDVEAAERALPAEPSIRPTGQQVGSTLTIAFSDIEESTQQAEAMGDHRWYRALIAHNAIIEGLVDTYEGTVIKSVGDGFMITFPSAGWATRWAIAVQRQITSYGVDHPEEAVRVRLGLHTGEAIQSGGDLFGTHVNTAARIANLAAGGEILVSSLTRAIAAPTGDFEFGPERAVTLKGLSGSHLVSELLWTPEPEDPAQRS